MKAEKTNGSSPPVGKASDSAPSAPNAGSATQGAAAPIPGQHHGDARERQEEAGNRAAANGEHGEPGGEQRDAVFGGRASAPRPIAIPRTKVRRPVNSIVADARPEPKGREAGPVAVRVTGEGAEQPGGRHRGQGADQPRPERRAQRRKEDAVAGQVVAPVPVVVPEQEAVRGEQVGAKRLRRMIGAGGLQDQVRDREDGGHEHAGG